MSIHTNAIPETSKIRDQSKLRPADMTPRKSNESVELEISLPMLLVFIVAIGVLAYGLFSFFGNKDNSNTISKKPPTVLVDGMVDVTLSTEYLTILEDSKNAKYAFVEFSDYECPYCKGFTVGFDGETVSSYAEIKKRYVDSKVMKHMFAPYIAVPSHKPAATNETLGFYCAAAQGKAREYHEKAFQKTTGNGLGIDKKGAERGAILNLAKEIGVNEAEFAACYDKRDIVAIDRIQEKIEKDVKTPWGDKFGSQNFGTPAFAVCKISADNPTTCVGKAYVGAWPYADMKGVLDTFLGADAPK
ncbi:thioredoxin domain-containing protein [bacterium]|nr:thioredoxin domain-containing protein [bacterium]